MKNSRLITVISFISISSLVLVSNFSGVASAYNTEYEWVPEYFCVPPDFHAQSFTLSEDTGTYDVPEGSKGPYIRSSSCDNLKKDLPAPTPVPTEQPVVSNQAMGEQSFPQKPAQKPSPTPTPKLAKKSISISGAAIKKNQPAPATKAPTQKPTTAPTQPPPPQPTHTQVPVVVPVQPAPPTPAPIVHAALVSPPVVAAPPPPALTVIPTVPPTVVSAPVVAPVLAVVTAVPTAPPAAPTALLVPATVVPTTIPVVVPLTLPVLPVASVVAPSVPTPTQIPYVPTDHRVAMCHFEPSSQQQEKRMVLQDQVQKKLKQGDTLAKGPNGGECGPTKSSPQPQSPGKTIPIVNAAPANTDVPPEAILVDPTTPGVADENSQDTENNPDCQPSEDEVCSDLPASPQQDDSQQIISEDQDAQEP